MSSGLEWRFKYNRGGGVVNIVGLTGRALERMKIIGPTVLINFLQVVLDGIVHHALIDIRGG
ncbi:hypothetical protein DDE05_09045 [Streptomyces cavourensis]|nr:hypothetical protein DDE05_09045 [Streptomyces cavourensis]